MEKGDGQYEKQEQVDHQGFLDAAQFVERQSIENEAWYLLQTREQSLDVPVLLQERRDNARTALMEALTASGHLSRVEITGTLEEINAQVLSRLLNGWDDNLPEHEKKRRFAELCNELYIQKIHSQVDNGQLPPGTALAEISDYPESMSDSVATSLGYRRNNKKGMVRSTHLEYLGSGQYKRVIEQVSRSNGTWNSTFSFLDSCHIRAEANQPDIAALEAPVIYTHYDYVDGVVDVMRLLDRHAGVGVRYGDIGQRTDKHPDYGKLRQESTRREQEIECYIDSLAILETQLDGLVAERKIDRTERNNIFKGEVDRILSAICTLEPGYAEATFGKTAAAHFHHAAELVAGGRVEEAAQVLETAQYFKETVTFCGMSISVEKAKEMGLEVNSFGELIEDGKESWKWKKGVCQVQTCSTRPGKTEVGPCSVCRKCQTKFDANQDPTKATRKPKEMVSLFDFKPKTTKQQEHESVLTA